MLVITMNKTKNPRKQNVVQGKSLSLALALPPHPNVSIIRMTYAYVARCNKTCMRGETKDLSRSHYLQDFWQ